MGKLGELVFELNINIMNFENALKKVEKWFRLCQGEKYRRVVRLGIEKLMGE